MQMIERVARAIEATKPKSDWPTKEEVDRQARAAIEAMRDPTDYMLEQGSLEESWPIAKRVFGSMIDAALQESKET